MSDIVERLRQYDRSPRLWIARLFEAGEAADEIGRLRAEEARMHEAARLRMNEIERLRAVIVALRTDCDCEPAHEAARRALEGPQSSAASNACEQDEGA